MQSVYKFPLALYVLHLVDSGVLSLDQKIHLKKSDLLPNLWSPLREKYPHGNVDVSLREIIRFTVSQSDNSGCDLLFRMVGGPTQVERWIHNQLAIKDITIANTENEIQHKWNIQYANWCTPLAMTRLLALFHTGQVLTAESRAFLWSCMVETTTGPRRIKGLLPEKTVVAHKTGTSGTRKGVTAAINDAGIIVLPNDRRVAVVVFVSETHRTDAEAERIIAEVAKAVWEAYAEE
jgi:beta-lactamase class A